MYTLNTGDEHIPEWTEENKQKLREVLQHIKDNYRQPVQQETKTIFFSTPQERHRQHTDPYILAKLEEGRANRSLWLDQTGVDIEGLVGSGFDANSGGVK